jgi:PAS domain S-box-containing protein
MAAPVRERSVLRLSPLRISVIFTAVALLWIVLSDSTLAWLGFDTERVHLYQTLKGAAFVTSCGVLIFLLTRAATRQAVREARRAEESELRYRALVETLPIGVFVQVRGRIVFVNQALLDIARAPNAEALIGHDLREFLPEIHLAEITDRIRILHEERKPVPPLEYRLTRLNGEEVFVEFASAPINFEGQPAALVVLRDVTERRRAFERQRVLMSEIDHRVRNNLSTILSIAQSSIGSSKTLAEFGEAFTGRVRALADMHDLLADRNWESVSLRRLLERVVTPTIHNAQPGALALIGEDITVDGEVASALSMTVHELATNAAKHGAMRAGDGRIDVAWRTDGPSGDLIIEWVERGGPPASPPTSEGFGLSLLRSVVPYQLDGSVALEFKPGGLRCTLRVPGFKITKTDPPTNG